MEEPMVETDLEKFERAARVSEERRREDSKVTFLHHLLLLSMLRPPLSHQIPLRLRNVEQYQQPPHTLGAQLYPGPANPGYPAGPNVPPSYGPNPSQVGPAFGQKMPQAVAPSQAPRGFMPVNNTVQRPGMAPMQPPSPTQPAQAQPPAAKILPQFKCNTFVACAGSNFPAAELTSYSLLGNW
ncbi:PREDICTED: protein transport protein SEC31 homolog B-like [Nicotiana attenuata]|uniref:protein transport protein SEC31 homolog B-like n=1 Tax=Nicotiana attenuata TaxID=49451 RepID=UPI000904CCDC|nr:PREDICTED: protein transport protein SEC31 homolog B-like [Nicotiana attenuata]